MKNIIIGLVALGSISAFACNDLDSSKRAHTTTWTTLYQLGQIKSSFKNSGKIPVNSLRSLEISGVDGKIILADQIHQVLTVGRGAKSKTGSDTVLNAVVEASANDETVCDLANRLATEYQFHGE